MYSIWGEYSKHNPILTKNTPCITYMAGYHYHVAFASDGILHTSLDPEKQAMYFEE